jgi:processive 1,2-diacylglycerol beta-glucosyltransferase
MGLPSGRIVVSGIPILASFSREQDRLGLFANHGLNPEKPVVLLSAGMFGMMSGQDIIRILETIKSDAQIIVVCGKNATLKTSLDALTRDPSGEHGKNYLIVGHTDTMHEFLKMASVFIGKPGGLSTSECLACGVPMVVWDPIPGQELYNTYHILENGAGVLPDSVQTIGFKVDQILRNETLLEGMRKNARSLSFPGAAKTIVDAMLEHEDETPIKAFKKR